MFPLPPSPALPHNRYLWVTLDFPLHLCIGGPRATPCRFTGNVLGGSFPSDSTHRFIYSCRVSGASSLRHPSLQAVHRLGINQEGTSPHIMGQIHSQGCLQDQLLQIRGLCMGYTATTCSRPYPSHHKRYQARRHILFCKRLVLHQPLLRARSCL